jgi:hypothetical protein
LERCQHNLIAIEKLKLREKQTNTNADRYKMSIVPQRPIGKQGLVASAQGL